jgi:hypothetical protein
MLIDCHPKGRPLEGPSDAEHDAIGEEALCEVLIEELSQAKERDCVEHPT